MLSKYGRMRERYLKEHKKILYYNLLTSGKLYEHLAEIDTSACNMAEYLIKEMARKQGVTEQLKAVDMMRWLRRWTKGYTIKQPNMDCQPTEITALMRHRAVFS